MVVLDPDGDRTGALHITSDHGCLQFARRSASWSMSRSGGSRSSCSGRTRYAATGGLRNAGLDTSR